MTMRTLVRIHHAVAALGSSWGMPRSPRLRSMTDTQIYEELARAFAELSTAQDAQETARNHLAFCRASLEAARRGLIERNERARPLDGL
jgi:hypothetical protein